MLPVKAMLLSAPSSLPANVLYHPQDGCRLVHASSELRLRVSFIRESRLHFGGLCHTAGLRQKAGNNVGTQAETFVSHWKAFFSFFSLPSPNLSHPQRGRQTQCLLAAGKSLTHFLQLQTRGQSPFNIAHMAQSIFTPMQRLLLNKKQSH